MTEIEKLRRENEMLSEQVKLLVRTEQRLYRSQAVLDQQLARVRALSDFVLRCTVAAGAENILADAVQMLDGLLDVDQCVGLSLRRDRSSARCWRHWPDPGVSTEPEAARLVGDFDWLAQHSGPCQLDLEGDAPLLRPLRGWLNFTLPRRAIEGDERLIAIPLRPTAPDAITVVLLRRLGSRTAGPFVDVPGKEHLPFLQLLAVHLDRVLESTLLGEELRARSDELTRSNERLQRSIQDLAETQAQLVEAGTREAVGRLAAGVAHDFNNLLTVILAHATLILDGLTGLPEIQGDLERIVAATTRASGLTRQLLAVGRREPRKRERVDLNEVVQKAADLLRRTVGEDIELRLRLDPQLRAIRADANQIEQVLLNLVLNARDATAPGGKITVETHRSHYLPGAPSERFVGLAVVDNGCGMDERTIGRAFEPFFTTKSITAGSGMGLATVYGIVKQIGGTIDVDSQPGRGTRVEVRLPVESIGSLGAANNATPAILLAEDEEEIRSVICRILGSDGLPVLSAADGAEALAIFEREREKIGLILTDVVMPVISGPELVARVRKVDPTIPIVLMSGHGPDVLGERGVAHGELLLSKPFAPEELMAMVRQALRRESA